MLRGGEVQKKRQKDKNITSGESDGAAGDPRLSKDGPVTNETPVWNARERNSGALLTTFDCRTHLHRGCPKCHPAKSGAVSLSLSCVAQGLD